MTAKTILTFPAALIFMVGTAVAQDAAIDVNADGMYSFPELQAAMPDMTEEDFTALDVSGDGLLDADEITAATDAGVLPAMDG